MSQKTDGPIKAFLASATLAAVANNVFLRVKYDGSFNLILAGASDVELGVLGQNALVAAVAYPVLLKNAQGTRKMVANGAISKGVAVYAAASGQISATGILQVGISQEAAVNNNDIIEVLPLSGSSLSSVATTAAAGSTVTDAAALTATYNLVTGGDGTKGVKLPTAPTAPTRIVVKNNSSSALKVWPDAAATVNAIGSNGAISLAANTQAEFIAYSSTQWYTLPLLPS